MPALVKSGQGYSATFPIGLDLPDAKQGSRTATNKGAEECPAGRAVQEGRLMAYNNLVNNQSQHHNERRTVNCQ